MVDCELSHMLLEGLEGVFAKRDAISCKNRSDWNTAGMAEVSEAEEQN